jgi:hypothetical protein
MNRRQILRNCDSGSFFGALAGHTTDLSVQFHLGQSSRNKGLHSVKQGAVIDVLSDVHRFLLSGAVCAYFLSRQRKRLTIQSALSFTQIYSP